MGHQENESQGDFKVKGTLDHSANPSLPKIYSQNNEPTMPNNSFAFWWETSHSRMWLIINRNGTQYKERLT